MAAYFLKLNFFNAQMFEKATFNGCGYSLFYSFSL